MPDGARAVSIPADRLACCVPFCGRTHRAGRFDEWMCAEHWKLAPDHWRRLLRLFERRGRRDLANRMWDRIKAKVIERAMGISG